MSARQPVHYVDGGPAFTTIASDVLTKKSSIVAAPEFERGSPADVILEQAHSSLILSSYDRTYQGHSVAKSSNAPTASAPILASSTPPAAMSLMMRISGWRSG